MKVINNKNIDKIKIINKKLIFHTANVILIIFYLFPGSILGCFIYNNCQIQPHLTPDFFVSSNHVYVFVLISSLGLFAYPGKKIILYIFFMSFFLEFTHLVNPGRGFEIQDLAGNIVGVVISYVVFLFIQSKKKNK